MSRMFVIAIGLVLSAVVLAVLGALAVVEIPSSVVFGGLCLVSSLPFFLMGHIGRGHDRDVKQVQELATRGRRLKGRVVDVLPMTSPHGGAIFRHGGAQMVLQVELDRGSEGTANVTLHLVENSELARARIGAEVTVLEHPDAPGLRTIEGFLPNGIRAPERLS